MARGQGRQGRGGEPLIKKEGLGARYRERRGGKPARGGKWTLGGKGCIGQNKENNREAEKGGRPGGNWRVRERGG